MQSIYDRDGVVVYHGNCRDILPQLERGTIVTDPPYGIAYVHSGRGATSRPGGSGRRNRLPIRGDEAPFDPSFLIDSSADVVIWGANHFADLLPRMGRWLAWDKLAGMAVRDSFGDVEFAWHSRAGASRIISYAWKGVACEKRGESNGRRWHPSQKPVAVMQWSIEQARVARDGLVVDPYAGSGTTGIACRRMGLRCVLIEIDEQYIPTIVGRLESSETPLLRGES